VKLSRYDILGLILFVLLVVISSALVVAEQVVSATDLAAAWTRGAYEECYASSSGQGYSEARVQEVCNEFSAEAYEWSSTSILFTVEKSWLGIDRPNPSGVDWPLPGFDLDDKQARAYHQGVVDVCVYMLLSTGIPPSADLADFCKSRAEELGYRAYYYNPRPGFNDFITKSWSEWLGDLWRQLFTAPVKDIQPLAPPAQQDPNERAV
jgi:hypothetical protein